MKRFTVKIVSKDGVEVIDPSRYTPKFDEKGNENVNWIAIEKLRREKSQADVTEV